MKRIGYGQVEPNHLSAQRTSQIYAQLPANKNIKQLENGEFVKYDYANGEVNKTGKGEWMLVFNEVKLYDAPWRESYKDFAMIAKNYTEGSYFTNDQQGNPTVEHTVSHYGLGPLKGQMVPRVFKTNIGDIYTTNCFEKAGARGVETTMTDLELGDELGINKNGFLQLASELGTEASTDPDSGETIPAEDYEGIIFQVVKIYTMPDGQDGVKIMRIK